MAEYIEREALLSAFELADYPFSDFDDAFEMVENAPPADVAPVVRCKDCKYRTWFVPGYGCGNFESPFYKAVDEDVSIMTKPDDFCSYGEKRE